MTATAVQPPPQTVQTLRTQLAKVESRHAELAAAVGRLDSAVRAKADEAANVRAFGTAEDPKRLPALDRELAQLRAELDGQREALAQAQQRRDALRESLRQAARQEAARRRDALLSERPAMLAELRREVAASEQALWSLHLKLRANASALRDVSSEIAALGGDRSLPSEQAAPALTGELRACVSALRDYLKADADEPADDSE